MPAKLSVVLKGVNLKKLKEDKEWYASCERARQQWDKIKPFYAQASLPKNAFEMSIKHFDDIISSEEVQEFGKRQADKHSVFVSKLRSLNTLVKFYVIDVYNELDGKHVKFNATICEQEVSATFKNAEEDVLEGKICKALTNTGASDYQKFIKDKLLKYIKTLTDNITAYLDEVYHDGALFVFKKYDGVYKSLKRTPENRGLATSISATAGLGTAKSGPEQQKADYEAGRYQDAVEVLSGLSLLALDAGKNPEKQLCEDLLKNIPD